MNRDDDRQDRGRNQRPVPQIAARKPDPAGLAMLVGLAATISGCSSPDDGQWRVCTDAQGRRLPDAACQQGAYDTSYGHYYGGHAGWIFINRSYSAPAVGQVISSPFSTGPKGGTGAVLSAGAGSGGGKVYSAPSAGITHGGFGSFGEAFGSHGSGHGSGAGE
jgi:hypothetical protein